MYKFAHVIKSERTLYSIGIIIIFVLMSSVPQWGWLSDIEAQNQTNESSMVQDPTKVDANLSSICASSNDTSNMNDIVEVRCILRDARNAISADSADTAIQLIEEADDKLVSVLGVGNNESSSNVTNTSAIN